MINYIRQVMRIARHYHYFLVFIRLLFLLSLLQTSGGSDTSSEPRTTFISAGGGGPQSINEKDALFGKFRVPRLCGGGWFDVMLVRL